MGGSILDDVSSSALCPPSVLRQWGMNPIDCLGGTRSDHIIMDGRPMFASTAHGSVAAGWQVETRRDVMSCHCRPKMDPAKDRQRCRLDRPARTFVPVPETAWTAASRHFFRTVNDEPRLYFGIRDTTPQSKCLAFRCRSDCIARYVRIATCIEISLWIWATQDSTPVPTTHVVWPGACPVARRLQPMARPIMSWRSWGDPGQSFESDNLGGIDDDENTRECWSLERLPWYSWQSWEVRGVSSTSES